MFTIDTPAAQEYPALVAVWESSVRATHHFLKEEDLLYYKTQLGTQYLHLVSLSCLRDETGKILGFSGVAGDSLEMLFISADARGKGIGKQLLQHAIHAFGVQKVDVNEDNEQALGFYSSQGFRVISRSDLDGAGKPYPILHMALHTVAPGA